MRFVSKNAYKRGTLVNNQEYTDMKIIAHIRTDFVTKFGIPRQSGLIESLEGTIIFEPEYRNQDAFRGLDGFSHIWLIWRFSEIVRDTWSPMVRPPRLGGTQKMGVFATRSPFRPNAIGLSSVKLNRIEQHAEFGPVLHISGADLLDNTPIFDIKPYLPYTDSHTDAAGGFTESHVYRELDVHFPPEWLNLIPEKKREALIGVLSHDPRPHYQNDPERIYGFEFDRFNIKFRVENDTVCICSVSPQ